MKTEKTTQATEVEQKETFEAILHKNVYGKELYYLKLQRGNHETIMINIGEKNFQKINELKNAKEKPVLVE